MANDYDLIIVDAFSSDAIPIHLLTQEAMAIYLAKLAPGGSASERRLVSQEGIEPSTRRLRVCCSAN